MSKKCRITYKLDSEGKNTDVVKSVKAANGKESILFSSLQEMSKGDQASALSMYGFAYTDSFKKRFSPEDGKDWESAIDLSSSIKVNGKTFTLDNLKISQNEQGNWTFGDNKNLFSLKFSLPEQSGVITFDSILPVIEDAEHKSMFMSRLAQLVNKESEYAFTTISANDDSSKRSLREDDFWNSMTRFELASKTPIQGRQFNPADRSTYSYATIPLEDFSSIEGKLDENGEPISSEVKRIYDEVYNTSTSEISENKSENQNVLNDIEESDNKYSVSADSGVYYQLNDQSNVQQSIQELDDYLLNFMKQFGVRSKEFSELKSKLGVDALGATDVMNKLIWYTTHRNEETVPEEVGHMAVMLMGEKNHYIKELLDNIITWSEYKSIYDQYIGIYKNEKQVKIEAIGKLIAKSLVRNYKDNKLDQTLLEKALNAVKEFIASIVNSLSVFNAMQYNDKLADHIALNILMGNKNFIATIDNKNYPLNYEKALNQNPHARNIIDTYTSLGYKLTGSLAIAGQGEIINRSSSEPIHDLDFVVDTPKDYEQALVQLDQMNAVPLHFGWEQPNKEYTTYAFLIPKKGFSIKEISRGNKGWLNKYELINENGKVVQANSSNVMGVDFFVYENGEPNTNNSKFLSVNSIYSGKLGLSPIGTDERLFQRPKDQEDYILHKPNRMQQSSSNFIYYQLNDKNLITPNDKVVFGHPTKIQLVNKFAHIYDIMYNGEKIGKLELPLDLEGPTVSIGDVEIDKKYRGLGLGVEVYKAAMSLTSKPLESMMASDEANRVWKSLVKQGLAVKTEFGYKTISSSSEDLKSQTVKEGVDVVFKNHPELANVVYETYGARKNQDLVNNLVRYMTPERKKLADDGDVELRRKWIQEEISELYDAIRSGDIDNIGEETLGLFRAAKINPEVKNELLPYMSDIKKALASFDYSEQYAKWIKKKHAKKQAEDETEAGLKAFIDSFNLQEQEAMRLYSKYLESKGVTQVAFHHSDSDLSSFSSFPQGYFSTNLKAKGSYYKEADDIVFFVKKPLVEEFMSKRKFTGAWGLMTPNVLKVNAGEKIGDGIHPDIDKGVSQAVKNGFDAVDFGRIRDNKTWSEVVAITNPNKAVKLGSKQDVEGFKNFLSNSEILHAVRPKIALETEMGLTNKDGNLKQFSTQEKASSVAIQINSRLKQQGFQSHVARSVKHVGKGMQGKIFYTVQIQTNPNFNPDLRFDNTARLLNKYTDGVSNKTSSSEILKRIIDLHKNDKSGRAELAKRLLENLSNDVTVSFITAEEAEQMHPTEDFSLTSGIYLSLENEIYIISDSHRSNSDMAVTNTILHEIIHAITYKYLKSTVDKEQADKFKKFYEASKARILGSNEYKALKAATDKASKDSLFAIDYALSNADEFLTAMFTTGDFIRLLKQLPAIRPAKEIKSMWQEFVDLIRQLLRIADVNLSLLDDAMSIGAEVIEKASTYNPNAFPTELSMDDVNAVLNGLQMDQEYIDQSFGILHSKAADFELTNSDTANYRGVKESALTQVQKDIIAKHREHHMLFEDNLGEELEKVTLSIENDIIPRIKEEIKDRKALRKAIEYWNLLALKGDEIERYQIRNPDGTVTYVLNRVTDAQSYEYNKRTKRYNSSKEIEESEVSIIQRELGTFAHGIMESLMNSLAMERPMVGFNDDGTIESEAEFVSDYSRRGFTMSKHAPLKELYADIRSGKEERIREVDVEVLERTALAIYYEIYKTQHLINLRNLKHTGDELDSSDTFVFFTEAKSYNKESNTAGTQDLLVFYSNGQVGKFDYKFNNAKMKREALGAGNKDVLVRQGLVDEDYDGETSYMKSYVYVNDSRSVLMSNRAKMRAYNMQLAQYSDNLVTQYGAKGILQSRIVPINMKIAATYDEDTNVTTYHNRIQFLGTEESFRLDDSTSLAMQQIATDREMTIDKDLNKLVERLSIELAKQSTAPADTNNKTNAGNQVLYDLNNAINVLRTKLSADHLLSSANELYEEIKSRLDKEADIIAKTAENPDYDPEDDYEDPDLLSIDDIMQYIDLLNAYQTIGNSINLTEQALALERGSESKEVQYFRSVITKINTMNSSYLEKMKELRNKQIFDYFKREKIYINEQQFSEGKYAFKDIGFMTSMFNKATEMQHPILQAMTRIRDMEIGLKEKRIVIARNKLMNNRLEKYEAWAKTKNLSGSEIYEPLISEITFGGKSDIKLIRKYDYSKWDAIIAEKQDMIRDKNKMDEAIAWLKENAMIDESEYNKEYRERERKMKAMGYSKETIEIEMKEFENRFDVENNDAAWANRDLIYYLKPVEEGPFLNEKYRELTKPENKPALDMLNHFYDLNNEIKGMLGGKNSQIHKTFIPNMYSNFAEDLDRNGIASTLKINELFSRAINANLLRFDEDEMFGANRQGSDDLVVDEFGRRMVIPVMFVDEISDGVKYKSRDLAKSFILMYKQAVSYNLIRGQEAMALALRQNLQESKLIETDKANNTMTVNGIVAVDKDAKGSATAMYLDNMLRRDLYGINEFTKDVSVEVNDKTYSGQKALSAVSGYVSVATLAFNMGSAIGGYMSTRMQLKAEAAKGNHFSKVALEDVFSAFKKRDTKQILAELFFDIAQDDRVGEQINKNSAVAMNRKIAKMFGDTPLMLLQRVTDDRIENTILSAMMRHYGIGPNGEVKPLHILKELYAGEYDTDKFMSIYDAMQYKEIADVDKIKHSDVTNPYNIVTLRDVNGNVLKYSDADRAIVLFRNRVRGVIGNVKGNQAADDKAMYQNYVHSRELMKFRGWIPSMFKERFTGTNYNPSTAEVKTGRYRVAFGEVFNNGVVPSAKNVVSLIAEVSSFGVFKGFSKQSNLAQHYYEVWKAQHPGQHKQWLAEWGYKDDMSDEAKAKVEELAFEKYKKHREGELRATSKELQMYLGVALVLMLMLGLAGGKVDKEDPWAYRKAYELLARANSESAYFFNPYEGAKIFSRGPAPTLNILTTLLNFSSNTMTETFDVATMSESNKTRNFVPAGDPTSSWGFSWLNEVKDNSPRFMYTAKIIPGISQGSKFLELFDTAKEEEQGFTSWLLGTNAGGTGDR